MSTRNFNNSAYGLTQALIGVPQFPIISKRAPLTSDKAEIGTIWVDQTNDDAFILMSIVNNLASWQTITGGYAAFNEVVINPGDLTVDIGNINVTLGNITATAGDISTSTGDIITDTGSIEATLGVVTAGAGFVATTGGLTATAGNITAVSDDIVATLGNITANAGDITASLGSVIGTQLNATGDLGGVASETAMTNVDNHTLDAGVMTINSTTANPGTNTGFLKFYLGVTPIWVPYFTNIAP